MGVSATVRSSSSFSGFPPQTLEFLTGLSKNNNKAWFEAHRAQYDEAFVGAGKAFVSAVGPGLEAIAPNINAEPKINGSIFRINRDIRFSKDKTPYKDHLDMWFWEGDRKAALTGFFVRFAPKAIYVGAGCHGMDGDGVKRFRSALGSPKAAAALAKAASAVEKAGYTLEGAHYKRPPKGIDTAPATERFLLFNSLHAGTEEPVSAMSKAGVVDLCLTHWTAIAPLHRWLGDHVQA